MISVQNIVYCYPSSTHEVMSGLSLEFKTGSIYGLLGANGTGKTTLLYLMCGLLKPQSGIVTINGENAFNRLPSVLADVFIVPEEIELPALQLSEYVEMTAPFYPNFSAEDMARYLDHFRLSTDIHLGALSMGQRKKAYIAFALACNTKVLLMDEPTNGLDIPGKAEFRRAIVSAMTDDRMMVISTHQVRDLDRVLDYITIIDPQGVLFDAPVADVQQKMRFFFTPDAGETAGALWSMPVVGGYNVIKPRLEGEEETDINLESLFEYTFSNSENPQQL